MKVAIIGRPNVGKSSLFNRIIGHRKAIVEPSRGVTRDRLVAQVKKRGYLFSLIDTGGFAPYQKDRIAKLVTGQARQAINEAEIIILVCEATTGLTDLDKEIAQLVRQANKPAILTINKADNEKLESSTGEFYSLGMGEPLCVSATQGRGIDQLLEKIIEYLPSPVKKKTETAVKVAVVGRPNVGKSSFVNRLLEEERIIVDDKPGTTRDAIDTEFTLDHKHYILIDTAGIRRKSKIKTNIDLYSLSRTEEAINRCDVALVLIDAEQGLTSEDIKIIGLVLQKYKGCVLALNKWDLVKDILPEDYEQHLRLRLKFINFVPIIFISALTGKKIKKAIQLVAKVEENTRFKISTSLLNNLWGELCEQNPPPAVEGKRPKIYYATQTGIKPPTFLCFSNYPKLIRKSYTSFLENNLRQKFGLLGTPIKIQYRLKK